MTAATGAGATTPAVGGERQVPVADRVAREYLLLALRLDQHVAGLVDGYFGPADLKAQVDMEPIRSPGRLADDARALRARLAHEVDDGQRRDWLDAQLVALEAQAMALAGEELAYVEHLRRCFTVAPQRRDDAGFDEAAAQLDALLPGSGPVAERLHAWDDRFVIPVDAVRPAVDWLSGAFRERAAELWGVPDGEEVRFSFVRNQPWTGYNWYDGGFRSRFDLNLDLPVRVDTLLHVVAHETYFGHHLEHTWREAEQVLRHKRLEASVLLINTPECLISEGFADLGIELALPPGERRSLLAELCRRAGIDADAGDAERHVAMGAPRRRLGEVRVNAALLRHADGAGHDEVLAYLRDTGRLSADAAAKRLEFIEHPLWKTYVFVYHEGEALLRRWVATAPDGNGAGRFGRLLREPLTPRAIETEAAASA